MSAYIGGEKGQGEVLTKVSDAEDQDYLEDTNRDRGIISMYSVYLGVEYYLGNTGSFSISAEMGTRGLAMDVANIETEVNFSFASVGMNYYF